MFLPVNEQMEIITKGALEVIQTEDLQEKLREGRPLRIKLGLDPSAPDLHLGHAVVLRKIRQMQELGHEAIIIIGDFTGAIGDPSGKSKTRPQLTREQVEANALTYQQQLYKILDREKTTVLFNSSWLGEMNFRQVLELASQVTVARILERDDFANRFAKQQPIGLHEFFYPLMQAWDSIQIQADIELGGQDQRFNILMGRTLQKSMGMESQVALFMPLLVGLDGVEKMSKSLGNYVGITEDANTMFQKIMKIGDEQILSYYTLCTDLHPRDIRTVQSRLEEGENPRDVKMELAHEITRLYHDASAADMARQEFIQIFQKRAVPATLPLFPVTGAVLREGAIDLTKVLVQAGLASSGSEVRRLVAQAGVKAEGIILRDFLLSAPLPVTIQVGKAKYVKLVKDKALKDPPSSEARCFRG